MEQKSNSKIRIIIIIIAALVLAAVVGFIAYSSGEPARKLKAKLELGQKYLNALEYEQAVATFKEALDMNPDSGEAKESLAYAYIGWAGKLESEGNIDRAIEVLAEGYELLKDQRILDKKNELVEIRIELEKDSEAADTGTEDNVTLFDTLSTEDQDFMMNILFGEKKFLDGFLAGDYTDDLADALKDTIALIYAYQGTPRYKEICERNNVASNSRSCRIVGEDYITYFSYRGTTHFDTLFGKNGNGWYVASADQNGIHSVIICPYSGGKANGTAYYFNNAHDTATESSMTVLQVVDGSTKSYHLIYLSGRETEEYSSPEQIPVPDWWPVY